MSLLIVHEHLLTEAQHIQQVLKTFGVASTIVERSLDDAYSKGKTVSGFLRKSQQFHQKAVGSNRAVVLTQRDVFASEHADSWVFGYNRGEMFVAVTARLQGKAYLDRIAFVVLHEIAHEAVKSRHLKEAVWMGQGFQQKLGKHCTDSKCSLYEIVDLKEPTDGYLLLGREQRFDAGLDGLMKRRYKEFFCKKCLPYVKKYLTALSQ
jgi:hypothetical protein